jgi:hypothetical protein
VITQARKGNISEQEVDEQLVWLSAQELALKQEMGAITDIALLPALDRWEDHTRQYLADM